MHTVPPAFYPPLFLRIRHVANQVKPAVYSPHEPQLFGFSPVADGVRHIPSEITRHRGEAQPNAFIVSTIGVTGAVQLMTMTSDFRSDPGQQSLDIRA